MIDQDKLTCRNLPSAALRPVLCSASGAGAQMPSKPGHHRGLGPSPVLLIPEAVVPTFDGDEFGLD